MLTSMVASRAGRGAEPEPSAPAPADDLEARSAPAPRAPFLLLLALGTAGLLQAVLQLVPAYDPYGWLVWGRQTIHLALDPSGAPSWKPLPWLLSTPLTVLGGPAPVLWLLLIMASTLAMLWLVYRLADRLAGPWAGAAAVGATLLIRGLLGDSLTGNSESLAAALALGAVEAHLGHRRRLALCLLGLVALARPEVALILGLYLLWLWREDPRARVLAIGVVIAIPLLWLVPPYLAGHQITRSDPVFQHSNLPGPTPFTVLHGAITMVIWPVAVAALLGAILAARRGGLAARLAFYLAAGIVAWTAVAAGMTLAGFPGIQRFLVPAAVAGSVLAGAGVVLGTDAARRLWRDRGFSPRLGWGAAILVATLFAVWARYPIINTAQALQGSRARADDVQDMSLAIARSGGPGRLHTCGPVNVELAYQSALAWVFRVPVASIHIVPRLALEQRTASVLVTANPVLIHRPGRRLLGHSGRWWVLALHPARACRLGTVTG